MLRVEESGNAYMTWPSGESDFLGVFGPEDSDCYRELNEPTESFWRAWHHNRHQMRDLNGFVVYRKGRSWGVTRNFFHDTYRPGVSDDTEYTKQRKFDAEQDGCKFEFVEDKGWKVWVDANLVKTDCTLEMAVSIAELHLNRRLTHGV